MGSFDALLVPSLLESFGRVAAEAMAQGLPLVASKAPGHLEIVRDGENGFLFDPSEPSVAAKRLRQIFSDPALRSKLATGAQRTAERYHIQTVGPLLERQYARVSSSAARLMSDWPASGPS
jgi:glycosyltransferase involved in cell wall biosynthesis